MSKHLPRTVTSILFIAMLAVMVLPGLSVAAQEPTTVTFWHAMSGSRADVVQQLVDGFNAANPDVQVVADAAAILLRQSGIMRIGRLADQKDFNLHAAKPSEP